LPLFAATVELEKPTLPTVEIAPLYEALNEIDPDNMSPKQALDVLYRLKTLVPGCADGVT
jgi:DNA mismatch repair protein MutS